MQQKRKPENSAAAHMPCGREKGNLRKIRVRRKVEDWE
jgi:hypothetical protein